MLPQDMVGWRQGSGKAFGVKSTFDFYNILPKVKRRLDP